jgi:DNA-directed RNA polymerase specialized sigma24 family protein
MGEPVQQAKCLGGMSSAPSAMTEQGLEYTLSGGYAKNPKQRLRRPIVGLDPADGFLDRLADPHSQLAHEWDQEHDKHVVEKLMAVVQPDFTPATWEAFQRFGVDGVSAERVALELGLSENAVILAKSRSLKQLREEVGDLLG